MVFAAVIVLGAVLVPLFCFAASCDSEGSSYYIRFTLDGTAYDLSKGATDINAVAFGNIVNIEGSIIFMGGTSDAITSEQEPDQGIMIMLNGTTAGTYSLVEEDEEALVMIILDGTGYDAVSGSIVVTVVGEVGGAIEGTFSGTFTGGEASATLTNGSFRVQRLADDTYFPDMGG
jgi:hypothetical protein